MVDQLEIAPIEDTDSKPFMAFLQKYEFAAGEIGIFSWYRSIESTTMFALKDSGRIIGTGISYAMGKTGWIGSICVDEEHRRQGLGRRLTDYAVERLKEQGCSTVLLRASETGALVYESLGFRVTGKYENFLAPQGGWRLPDRTGYKYREITSLETGHFKLETRVSGENKENYLKALPGGKGLEISSDGLLQGFAYPTIGDGFLGIVENEELIEPLMARFANGKQFKIRTLVGSRSNDFLRSLGYKTEDGAIRMALGNDPIIKIRNVVGTISSSIG